MRTPANHCSIVPDTATPSPGTAKPESPPVAAAAPTASRRTRSGWLVLVAVLVIAALPLGGAYLWQRVWLPLQRDIADDRQALQDLAQRHTALETWQASASDDLSALEKHHRDLADRLEQLEPGRLGAWALAEAEYLVRSAQRAVAVDHDPQRAAIALRLASLRLAPLPNSGNARRAIDNARTALRAVHVPVVGSLGDQLAAAAATLNVAPLREPGAAPAAPAATGWRGALAQAWQQLGEVVVVQRVGTPVQPLLRPHETQYLRQQLALKLTAADYALQRRDTASFQRELRELQGWADAYLDARAEPTARALATLARLANVDLRPPLPDLSGLDEPLAALRRATIGADGADNPT
jgi:uroporphyrin-3 C-methyltransferase